MKTGRMEAFSDGVLAILITIMVLEIKIPIGESFDAIRPLAPLLLAYVLSFIYLGIYWNNHHHLLQASERVSGGVLWANLHLLFWLSLVPVASGWLGESHFGAAPVAAYGTVLFCAGIAYYFLTRTLIACHGPDSLLARSIGADWKTIVSLIAYGLAIPFSFVQPYVSCAAYAGVAALWLVPDRRIEMAIRRERGLGKADSRRAGDR